MHQHERGAASPEIQIVFATGNRGKLRELRQLLDMPGLRILALSEVPDAPEIEEDGETFAENAARKAFGIMGFSGLPTLADDSGLEVDALGGAPGVRSARYAGEGASDQDRIDLLLRNLRGVAPEQRTARFRCAVAFADPSRPAEIEIREGTCEGRILEEQQGEGGFGYDPVFFVESHGQTFAEMPAAEKNQISHRGRAMAQMVAYLKQWLRTPAAAAAAQGPAR